MAKQLEEMKLSFLLCRTERHKWDIVTDRDIITDQWGGVVRFTRHNRCDRCDAERLITISTADFTVIHRSPIYPPGYLARGVRIPVAEARREQFSRGGLKIAKRGRNR